MGRVIVGVDESDGAAQALRWAADLAGRRSWSLTAVLAWDFLAQHRGSAEAGFDPSYDEAAALRALDEIVGRVLGDATGVERRAVNDLPARALLDASPGSDLLIVGARGLGGFKGLLLGSVSQQVLRHSTVPVAVVRSGPDRPTGERPRIVAAYDGSEPARSALHFAAEEAALRQGQLVVVHAWDPAYLMMGPAGTLDRYEQESVQLVDSALTEVDVSGLPTPVERVSEGGSAAVLILEQAARSDLVVMGSRGAGGFKGLLLGSVASHVTHHAACPVVVIPPSHQ